MDEAIEGKKSLQLINTEECNRMETVAGSPIPCSPERHFKTSRIKISAINAGGEPAHRLLQCRISECTAFKFSVLNTTLLKIHAILKGLVLFCFVVVFFFLASYASPWMFSPFRGVSTEGFSLLFEPPWT